MDVLDKRVLRNVFETEREEVAGGWRQMDSARIYDLHSSSDTIRVIKCRRMRWARHVARIAAKRRACGFLVENPAGKSNWKTWL